MGLKGWLFGDFIDYIESKNSNKDSLIWQFPLEEKEISYNAQIVVDKSQIAVIFIEHNIFDALSYGRYNLNKQTLPNISYALKWDEEHDEPFSAHIYFLNKNSVTFYWDTKEPILLHDRDNSIAQLDANGTFKTHIINVTMFLDYVLNNNILKNHNIISKILEDNLIDVLTHRSSSIYKLASQKIEFSYFLKSRLANIFTKNGLILEELETQYLNVEQKLFNNEDNKNDSKYYIIKNSKPDGPYTKSDIERFIEEEKLIPASYIWKDGLKDWVKLRELFDMD